MAFCLRTPSAPAKVLVQEVHFPADYSKRVYQGVRVKHTVKDLLAEKRSRQTTGSRFNGSTNTSQTQFVQMSGSPSLSSYYSVRRPYLPDSDYHTGKQYSNDIYPSALGSKPLTCESSSGQGYPPLLDPYFTEPFGDYRTTSAASSTGSLFSASALPSILPHYPGESSHYLLRDSWEQTVPDSIGQSDVLCPETLQAVSSSTSNCLTSHHDPASGPQYRSSSRGAALPGTQSYSLHPLDDGPYSTSFSATPSYAFSPFMTVPNELTTKMVHFSSEENSEASTIHDASSWPKEDGGVVWGPYEFRRNYQ
ncbi:POU domain class 2-associating factor 2 [Ambystoma mexicanum]|uniref:POU domain class 2-associating factor 2 n=1 Tax=Ambystoma mexicanum TaxID=8296 RepID=UPI0037E94581